MGVIGATAARRTECGARSSRSRRSPSQVRTRAPRRTCCPSRPWSRCRTPTRRAPASRPRTRQLSSLRAAARARGARSRARTCTPLHTPRSNPIKSNQINTRTQHAFRCARGNQHGNQIVQHTQSESFQVHARTRSRPGGMQIKSAAAGAYPRAAPMRPAASSRSSLSAQA